MSEFKVKQLPQDYKHPYWGNQGGYWAIVSDEGVHFAEKCKEDIDRYWGVLKAEGFVGVRSRVKYAGPERRAVKREKSS